MNKNYLENTLAELAETDRGLSKGVRKKAKFLTLWNYESTKAPIDTGIISCDTNFSAGLQAIEDLPFIRHPYRRGGGAYNG
jgi:hypothetical protein